MISESLKNVVTIEQNNLSMSFDSHHLFERTGDGNSDMVKSLSTNWKYFFLANIRLQKYEF